MAKPLDPEKIKLVIGEMKKEVERMIKKYKDSDIPGAKGAIGYLKDAKRDA